MCGIALLLCVRVCVWTVYRLVRPGFHMVCDIFFSSHAQELLVLFIHGYIYVHVNMTQEITFFTLEVNSQC